MRKIILAIAILIEILNLLGIERGFLQRIVAAIGHIYLCFGGDIAEAHLVDGGSAARRGRLRQHRGGPLLPGHAEPGGREPEGRLLWCRLLPLSSGRPTAH